MRTLSIINLKGGVAKTISVFNMAYIMSKMHGKRVLIVDNDKQGNISKSFGRHSYDREGTEELMLQRRADMDKLIQSTDYPNIDIVAANMNLLTANMQVMLDNSCVQQTKFAKAFSQIQDRYDFCIIDNAPDINISTINALVASDDVMIPITVDEYSLDGLAELCEQIEDIKEDLNENLRLCGCFVTQYEKSRDMHGIEKLNEMGYYLFSTKIRRAGRMKDSTFAKEPIVTFSPRSGASMDYKKLVQEYLDMCPIRTQE